jgi:tRNA-dihydrouridine synthase
VAGPLSGLAGRANVSNRGLKGKGGGSRNAGSACLKRPDRVESIARGMSGVLSCDLTLKVRKGYDDGADIVHTWLPRAPSWGVSAVVLHGRTRQQRCPTALPHTFTSAFVLMYKRFQL